jgi:hypothetical protein
LSPCIAKLRFGVDGFFKSASKNAKVNSIFALSVLVSLFAAEATAQQTATSEILNEGFSDNRNGWALLREEELTAEITGSQYVVDLTSTSPWNRRIHLPSLVGNGLLSDQATISFDMEVVDQNDQPYNGIGFVFDQVSEGNFNLLYIGHENGKIFTSIIPCVESDFKKPIKDGRGTNFLKGKNRISINRFFDTYKIYINNALMLTFSHADDIVFKQLYFTTGKYGVSDLHVRSAHISLESGDQQGAKPFVASNYQIRILLVGVGRTQASDYTPLNSPTNDVNAMKAFWMSPEGGAVPERNIVTLKNEEAKRKNILDNLAVISKKTTEREVIIVYLTGHGSLNGHFCCFDNLLAYSELNEILSTSKAKNKLIIIDACFSGYVKNVVRPPSKGGLTKKDLNDMFYYGISMASRNTAYLVSCLGTEISFDGATPTSNSTFTKALLQTLGSFNGKQKGDIITLSEVYSSLRTYFNQWNKEREGKKFALTQLVDGQTLTFPIPISMTPQLISENKQNNLPLIIVN